jgi:hypothetical protein
MVHPSRVLNYSVDDAFMTLARIESLCSAVLRTRNLILLPFGPKIFVLISLLAARFHYPEIAVWRVSGSEEIKDREPSDHVMGLRVTFSPSRETGEQ